MSALSKKIPPGDVHEHLTLVETAEWLRCSSRTLQRLLETGDGPPVVRLSERRLIFRLADVKRWIEGRTRGATHNRA
jgi:predicted DNA-binding transcriptional regulator AlpA